MTSKRGVSRRDFLAQAGALGAALAFGQSCAHQRRGPLVERRDLFPQGVASGDPAPDSVILWTRREPDRDITKHRLAVEVAEDPGFSQIAASATGRAARVRIAPR